MNVIHIYEPVTTATTASVKRQLDSIKSGDITVRINSPGGAVFEGLAIYQLLKSHASRVVVHIDGIAASIASVIALAGDTINIAQGAMLMLHDASIATRGNSRELVRDAATVAKVSESLTDIYVSATKQPRAKIRALMEAESWLSASEAVALGFAHKIVAAQKIAAQWSAKDAPDLPPSARIAAGLSPVSRRELSARIDRLQSENLELKAKAQFPAIAATATTALVHALRMKVVSGDEAAAVRAELDKRGVVIDQKTGVFSISRKSNKQ